MSTETLAPPAPPSPARGGTPPVPVRPRALHLQDVGIVVGCAGSALALTWLLYERLAPFSGGAGFVIMWFVLFIATYWVVIRDLEGRFIATDKSIALLIGSVAIGLMIPLMLIVGYVIFKGVKYLNLAFFTQTQAAVGPDSPPSQGGAAHAIVGTLQQVGLAMLLSVPLGIGCAVYMNEVGGRMVRPVRLFVDAMSGVPSIVAGLFIFTVWVLGLGQGFSGFAGALALTVLMLPTITRTSEEVLRLVPDGLREASLAVGATQWRTTWNVVLPTARSGLVTAVILGVARAIGETAPLIMTVFGAQLMNWNPFAGAQQSLPLFVYNAYVLNTSSEVARAWTGALVLILIVLLLFLIARAVGRSGWGTGGGQR